MKFTRLVFIAFVMSSLALALTQVAVSAECVITDLQVCMGAVSGSPPSTECCAKLKETQSCFCEYAKNPLFAPYIPAAKQILATCGLPIPSC
ncbi:Non-specific lipid-transfer protein 2G [Cardamine amara subsp. amara]|uniref:Non-specific lipid-transfer protein 2G n=1 Tax=Cardamine amara subsp. amara TaxID=228776 RepID=A0ABD1A568_CARAN